MILRLHSRVLFLVLPTHNIKQSSLDYLKYIPSKNIKLKPFASAGYDFGSTNLSIYLHSSDENTLLLKFYKNLSKNKQETKNL